MSYREPPYLLELVASFCALPLVLAYRLEGGDVGAAETLAWIALCWAITSAAHSWCPASASAPSASSASRESMS